MGDEAGSHTSIASTGLWGWMLGLKKQPLSDTNKRVTNGGPSLLSISVFANPYGILSCVLPLKIKTINVLQSLIRMELNSQKIALAVKNLL